MVGEITPEYSTIGPAGIDYLNALLPDVKIIYLIRRPVERALSQLRMNAARHGNHQPSAAVWQELAASWDVENRGDYRTYVPQWKARLTPNRLLFLPYGRIRVEPTRLLREIEDFLGLAGHQYDNSERRVGEGPTMAVPPRIVEELGERFAGQDRYLQEEFGAGFYSMT